MEKCSICGESRLTRDDLLTKDSQDRHAYQADGHQGKDPYRHIPASDAGCGYAFNPVDSVDTSEPTTTTRDIEDLASYMRGYADAMELYASLLEELAGFNG